jgi:hypothetical protein
VPRVPADQHQHARGQAERPCNRHHRLGPAQRNLGERLSGLGFRKLARQYGERGLAGGRSIRNAASRFRNWRLSCHSGQFFLPASASCAACNSWRVTCSSSSTRFRRSSSRKHSCSRAASAWLLRNCPGGM